MIALLEAWRAGLFRREHWLPNLVSGVNVGVVALPLAMDIAIATGVKHEQGLYPAIVGFSACIGCFFCVGQWLPFFGLPKIEGAHFLVNFWHLFQAVPHLHLA